MQATNICFFKIIKIGDRLREFNFRKLPNTENHFHVDVTDDQGRRHMFTLYKDNEGNWKSQQELPLWIKFSENLLGNVIDEETSQ